MDHAFHTEHASKKFYERYHQHVTRMDWIRSFLDIIEGRALFLGWSWFGRERYLVKVANQETVVVYDPRFAKFITALPRHRDKAVRHHGPRRIEE